MAKSTGWEKIRRRIIKREGKEELGVGGGGRCISRDGNEQPVGIRERASRVKTAASRLTSLGVTQCLLRLLLQLLLPTSVSEPQAGSFPKVTRISGWRKGAVWGLLLICFHPARPK